MRLGVLVLHPPIANSGLTLGIFLYLQSQRRAPQPAPPPEVAEPQQRGTTMGGERGLGSSP